MAPKVDILLATYNGGKYLKEQLASIASQTYQNWKLIIRDDLSTDDTPDILRHFSEAYPDRVQIIPSHERLGVIKNFSTLLETSTAPYIAFCDQDDVWDKDKVELLLHAIQKLETVYSTETPLLVHSDLRLVDQSLSPLAPSFWEYTHLYPSEVSFSGILTQNVVTGCACFFNRSLADAAQPIPKEALMHDWWLALVASCLGQVQAINQQTISYRQHNNNALGAMRFFSFQHIKTALSRLDVMAEKKWQQANVLSQRYQERLTPSHQENLDVYLSLKQLNWFQSRMAILKHGFLKQGFARQAFTLLFIRQP